MGYFFYFNHNVQSNIYIDFKFAIIFRGRYTILILCILGIAEFQLNSNSGILGDRKSDEKWIDIFTGKIPLDKTDSNDFTLDNILKIVHNLPEKLARYETRISAKLKLISNIQLSICDGDLSKILEPELSKNGQSTAPSDRYYQFFAKLQFNLCLREIDFERAQIAAEHLNRSKWIVWYDTIASDDSFSAYQRKRWPITCDAMSLE